MSKNTLPAAGWYNDGRGKRRYWDGAAWNLDPAFEVDEAPYLSDSIGDSFDGEFRGSADQPDGAVSDYRTPQYEVPAEAPPFGSFGHSEATGHGSPVGHRSRGGGQPGSDRSASGAGAPANGGTADRPEPTRPVGHGQSTIFSGLAARLPGQLPLVFWLSAAGLALLAVLAMVTSGMGGFLIIVGLAALGTGVFALATKRRTWAQLPDSRRLSAGIVATGLIVLLTGSGLVTATNTSQPVAAPLAVTNTGTPSTPTPRSTPTPTATGSPEAPDSPDTVVAALGPASVVIGDSAITSVAAIDLLATLPIKGSAPKTGYERTSQFGTAWLDVDRNGCDTRNDILARDLGAVVKSGPCKVTAGSLADPYTGTAIAFVRGNETSMRVQIDHVVPLLDAWRTGAQQLTQEQRVTLANDPLNLLAVSGTANAQKQAGNAATWLPANKSFRCVYVARQISVKATYGLWVTQAEHNAMELILQGCAGQTAFSSQFTPVPPPPPAPEPAPIVDVQPEPEPEPAPVEEVTEEAPAPEEQAGGGASALCKDGTLSYSQNRRGTCSHHGGVAQWY